MLIESSLDGTKKATVLYISFFIVKCPNSFDIIKMRDARESNYEKTENHVNKLLGRKRIIG